MVLHRLVRGGLKQHVAILRDERDAQIVRHKGGECFGLIHKVVTVAYELSFLFQPGPCLRCKGFVKNEDAQCSGEQQAEKSHQEQTVTDLFFHAADLHSSAASSSSVSL